MLKTGIESVGYFDIHNIEGSLREIKADGYDCMDFQGLTTFEQGLLGLEEEEYKRKLSEIADIAARVGVEIHQMHGLWPTDDTSEEKRKRTTELFKKQMRGASYLCCKNIVIHPFLPFGWGQNDDPEFTIAANEQLMRDLLPTAREYDVTICLENLPFKAYELSDAVELKAFVERIADEHVKICLDTGHANLYPQSIEEVILLLGEDLRVLHLHDNGGHADSHSMPYAGSIDWEGVIRGLRAIGYSGCMTLETVIAKKMPLELRGGLRKELSRVVRYLANRVSE